MNKADNLFDKIKNKAKDHRLIVFFIFLFLGLVGIGTLTDSLDKSIEFYKKYLNPKISNSKEHGSEIPNTNIQDEAVFRKTEREKVKKESERIKQTDNDIKTLKDEKYQGGTMSPKTRPKLWITYAWKDNVGGNFDFLIKELEKAGIDTTFDKVALVPGQRLWEQIATRIEEPSLSGWAILLTKQSIESEACKEELAYALNRALDTKGKGFPLLGLMHQISIEEVPAALRVRLLIDLREPEWPQLVLAGIRGIAPQKTTPKVSRYRWEIIPNFRGPGTIAISVRPRFNEIRNWRFIYPENAKLIDWGSGPPKPVVSTAVVSNYKRVLKGGDLDGEKVIYVGAGDTLTPGNGCYIVFREPFPKFVGFANADEPLGPPSMENFEYVTIR